MVPSPDLPVAPVLPSLPWLPVAPVGPAGPGTATGVAGTVTTVGLSQAPRLNVASNAEISIKRFMAIPFKLENSGTDGFETSVKNRHNLGCRTRLLNSLGACNALFSALANIVANFFCLEARYRPSLPACGWPGVNRPWSVRVPSIRRGSTQASNCSALTPPSASVASRSVVPWAWACFAICAARS